MANIYVMHIKLIPWKTEQLLELVPSLRITHLTCAEQLNMQRKPMLKMAANRVKRERKTPKRFIDEFAEAKTEQ